MVNSVNSSRSSLQIFHDAVAEQPRSSENAENSSVHSERSQTSLPGESSGIHHVSGACYYSANEAALHHKLAALFGRHIDGENAADFHRLIEDRTRQLHAMRETPESVEAVLTKGSRLDGIAQVTRGAVRAIPFAVASVAFDTYPQLSAFAEGAAQLGLHAGLQSGIADTFGGALLDKATADTRWLAAEPSRLEPVMQQASEQKKPSTGRLAGENAAAIQTYSLRNLLRLGTAAAVTAKFGPATAAKVDTWLTAGGGLVAGGLMSGATHAVDRQQGRAGPEYLLGRTDWKEQYLALKNTNAFTAPLTGAGKRLAKLPLNIATDGLRAGREVVSAAGMSKNGLLAGGFAATLSARSAVSQAMNSKGFNAASQAAMSHLTNVALSAPIFASVPAAEILAPVISEKLTQKLQEGIPGAVQWGADQLQARLSSHESGRPSGNS